jgi:MoxR-like ATPase
MKAAKCMAAIEGRNYVLPDDVKKMAVPTLAHRLMMTSSARLKLNAGEEVIKDIVEKAPVPTETVFDGVYN